MKPAEENPANHDSQDMPDMKKERLHRSEAFGREKEMIEEPVPF